MDRAAIPLKILKKKFKKIEEKKKNASFGCTP